MCCCHFCESQELRGLRVHLTTRSLRLPHIMPQGEMRSAVHPDQSCKAFCRIVLEYASRIASLVRPYAAACHQPGTAEHQCNKCCHMQQHKPSSNRPAKYDIPTSTCKSITPQQGASEAGHERHVGNAVGRSAAQYGEVAIIPAQHRMQPRYGLRVPCQHAEHLQHIAGAWVAVLERCSSHYHIASRSGIRAPTLQCKSAYTLPQASHPSHYKCAAGALAGRASLHVDERRIWLALARLMREPTEARTGRRIEGRMAEVQRRSGPMNAKTGNAYLLGAGGVQLGRLCAGPGGRVRL